MNLPAPAPVSLWLLYSVVIQLEERTALERARLYGVQALMGREVRLR